jgi:hypothetical protein
MIMAGTMTRQMHNRTVSRAAMVLRPWSRCSSFVWTGKKMMARMTAQKIAV